MNIIWPCYNIPKQSGPVPDLSFFATKHWVVSAYFYPGIGDYIPEQRTKCSHWGIWELLLATDVYCVGVSPLCASICQDLCVHQSPIQFEIEDTRKNAQKLLEWKMFVAYLTRIFISSGCETLKIFSKLNTTTCRRGMSFFIMSPQIATIESGTDFRKARNATTKFLKYCGVTVGYGSIILNFVLYNK